MDYLIPDNREAAALVWLLIASLWIVSRKDLRASVGNVFRTALHPKILLPIAVMFGYVTLEVWLGSKLSLWRSDLTKPTVIWMVVSGLAMLVSFDKASKEPRFYRRSVIEAFRVAAFLEFFMNVSSLSMLAEFLLQPTIAVLAMLSVHASQNDHHRSVKKTAHVIVALIGFSLLGYTARQLYCSWHQIDTHALLLHLALPIWLTIGFLPFIYVFSLFADYEIAFKAIDGATEDRRARWRGRIALLTKFHFRAR